MKKIYHYCGPVRNVGDQALVDSMRTNLLRASKQPLHFVQQDLKFDTPINRDMVQFINNSFDMLLVGGGGMVMAGDGFKTASGWQFNISLEDLLKIKVPVVVYSIGYNVFPGDKNLPPHAIAHLQATQRKASLFSVRNSGTAEKLEKLGLKRPEVVPDPALFMDADTSLPLPGISKKDRFVCINWAGDRVDSRWQGSDYGTTISKFASALKDVEKLTPFKILFMNHVFSYDTHWNTILGTVFGRKWLSLEDMHPWLYPEQPWAAPLFAGVYKRASASIGMRGHAAMIPFGQGCPTIAFGSHPKTSFFAHDAGCFYVDFSCGNLIYSLSTALTKGQHDQQEKLKTFRTTFDDFNRRVLEILE